MIRNFDIRNLVPVDGDEGSASSDQIPISSPYFPSFSHPLLIFSLSSFDLVFSEAPFIPYPEMEFLDNNLTKDLSILLHAIHSPFYWWILKKTRLFCAFSKSLQKNPRNKKTKFFHE